MRRFASKHQEGLGRKLGESVLHFKRSTYLHFFSGKAREKRDLDPGLQSRSEVEVVAEAFSQVNTRDVGKSDPEGRLPTPEFFRNSYLMRPH